MTQWLSIEKASLAINVSSRTMHRYIKSGKVRTKKIGNARLVSKDSLENFAMNPEATTNGNDENTLINNFDSNKKRPEFSPPTGFVICLLNIIYFLKALRHFDILFYFKKTIIFW